MDVRESVLAALKFEGESRVVDAEAVHDRGLEVVNVDGLIDDVETEIVGGAVGHAAFDAAAGHPDGEGFTVVVAAVFVAVGLALRVGRAAEFAAPDDERLIEEAAWFEVLDQCGAGLIDVEGELG